MSDIVSDLYFKGSSIGAIQYWPRHCKILTIDWSFRGGTEVGSKVKNVAHGLNICVFFTRWNGEGITELLRASSPTGGSLLVTDPARQSIFDMRPEVKWLPMLIFCIRTSLSGKGVGGGRNSQGWVKPLWDGRTN